MTKNDSVWPEGSYLEIKRKQMYGDNCEGANDRLRFDNGIHIPLPVSEMLMTPLSGDLNIKRIDTVYKMAIKTIIQRWKATRESIRTGGNGEEIFVDMYTRRQREDYLVDCAVAAQVFPEQFPNIDEWI